MNALSTRGVRVEVPRTHGQRLRNDLVLNHQLHAHLSLAQSLAARALWHRAFEYTSAQPAAVLNQFAGLGVPLALNMPVSNLVLGLLGLVARSLLQLQGIGHSLGQRVHRWGASRHTRRHPGHSTRRHRTRWSARHTRWHTGSTLRLRHLSTQLQQLILVGQRSNRRRLDRPWRIIGRQQHVCHSRRRSVHIGACDVGHHRAARLACRLVGRRKTHPTVRRCRLGHGLAMQSRIEPLVGNLRQQPLILNARLLAASNSQIQLALERSSEGVKTLRKGLLACGIFGVVCDLVHGCACV